MKNLAYFLAFLFITIGSISCSDDEDPMPPNPEEVITTLNVALTPVGGGTTVNFNFQDLDGDGGNAPTITVGDLVASTTYNAVITALNESVTPTDNITVEILAEDEDHQFFFQVAGANLGVAYTDQDADGNPVGLSSTFTTGAASTGTIIITLRHEPNKSATGVSSGDITNAGGETDIEVTFDVNIV